MFIMVLDKYYSILKFQYPMEYKTSKHTLATFVLAVFTRMKSLIRSFRAGRTVRVFHQSTKQQHAVVRVQSILL